MPLSSLGLHLNQGKAPKGVNLAYSAICLKVKNRYLFSNQVKCAVSTVPQNKRVGTRNDKSIIVNLEVEQKFSGGSV